MGQLINHAGPFLIFMFKIQGIKDDQVKKVYAEDLPGDNYHSEGGNFSDPLDDSLVTIGTEAITSNLSGPGQFVAYCKESSGKDFR